MARPTSFLSHGHPSSSTNNLGPLATDMRLAAHLHYEPPPANTNPKTRYDLTEGAGSHHGTIYPFGNMAPEKVRQSGSLIQIPNHR